MTDPLADMFLRIRNGSIAKFEKVEIPSSKIKREIAKILKEEGFIKNFKIIPGSQQRDTLQVFLKYDENRKGMLRLKRVSRPGRRVYVKNDGIQLPFILQALLAAIFIGASAPIAKLLLGDIAPVLPAALYIGSGTGTALVKLTQRMRAKDAEAGIKRPDIKWLAGAIISGGILAPIVLMISLQNTPPRRLRCC